MTWRTEKYKRAAAHYSRKETFRRKWIRGLRAQKAQFDLEWPVTPIRQDGMTASRAVDRILQQQYAPGVKRLLNTTSPSASLAMLNARTSGEDQ